MANVGFAQPRGEQGPELPLLTAGDDLRDLAVFLAGRDRYSADDVVQYLFGGVDTVAP